jgi:hypothetical protein
MRDDAPSGLHKGEEEGRQGGKNQLWEGPTVIQDT